MLNAEQIHAKYPTISIRRLAEIYPQLAEFANDADLEERIRNENRYAVFQEDLMQNMHAMRKDIDTLLIDQLPYMQMTEISLECREKLELHRPKNIAAASR